MRNDDPLAASNGVLEQHQSVVSVQFLLTSLLSLVFLSCFPMPSSPGFSTQLAKYEFDELCQPEGAVHQSYILYPASARQTRFYLHFDC